MHHLLLPCRLYHHRLSLLGFLILFCCMIFLAGNKPLFAAPQPESSASIALLRSLPSGNLWDSLDSPITGVYHNGIVYVPLERFASFFPLPQKWEDKKGKFSMVQKIGPQTVKWQEDMPFVLVKNTRLPLIAPPLIKGEKKPSSLWVPIENLASLAGWEYISPQPGRQIAILNISGTSIANRRELSPEARIIEEIKPYGYQELAKDLPRLQLRYPELRFSVLGTSSLGNKLPLITWGHGPRKIFLSGAWHGEEWITALFLTQFAELAGRNFDGALPKELTSQVTLYIAPMVNPDGCDISVHNDQLPNFYQAALRLAPPSFNLKEWRANGQGIDPNNQFPLAWETSAHRLSGNTPPNGTAGPAPLTAPESKSIFDFTETHDLSAILAYHSQGQVLHWRTADGLDTPEMLRFAEIYANATGYYLIPDTRDYTAGYRDWFVTTRRLPGLTVEVGSGSNPLPLNQYPAIWTKNRKALLDLLSQLDTYTAAPASP